MMGWCKYLLGLALAVLAYAGPCSAAVIVFGSHSSHPVIPGGSLSDIRLSVELAVSGPAATFTFTNVSAGLESSAVMKEIVIDTADDDTGEVFLFNGQVLTDTGQVGFSLGDSNGLPGFHDLTADATPLVELQANPSPVIKGLGIGEILMVRFDTSLPAGSDALRFLFAFDAGQDSAAGALGFHAISASTVEGESLSGVSVTAIPEPAMLALCSACALALLRRRQR